MIASEITLHELKDVLVVDDEAQIRNFLHGLLTTNGYSCAVAENGPQARAHLARRQFALVVCDLMMPGESDRPYPR